MPAVQHFYGISTYFPNFGFSGYSTPWPVHTSVNRSRNLGVLNFELASLAFSPRGTHHLCVGRKHYSSWLQADEGVPIVQGQDGLCMSLMAEVLSTSGPSLACYCPRSSQRWLQGDFLGLTS